MLTIDFHGMSLEEAKNSLEIKLENAYRHRERIVRIIHGQGKHSAVFPVIKSYVRHWLEDSNFSRQNIETVFRGEDGSPYTPPNAGETIVLLKDAFQTLPEERSWEEDEEYEAKRNAKGIRAEKNRTRRRRKSN